MKWAKLRLTSKETSAAVFGYTYGQAITSVLVTVYTFVVLSVLHVHAALVLDISSGLLEIPLPGLLIAAVLSFLLAPSASPKTDFIALMMHPVFFVFKVYLIVPQVCGE